MSHSILRTLLLLSALTALVAETAWGQEGSSMSLTTRNLPSGPPRQWESENVSIELDGETRTLTIVGHFPSLDPVPDPTQELTLTFRNFTGPRDYEFNVGDAEWENRNTGDGLCHYYSGGGEITRYDLVNNVLSGTFSFVCESTPQTGNAYKSVAEGVFTVSLERTIFSPIGGEVLKPKDEQRIEWRLPGRDKISVAYTLEEDPQREGMEFHMIREGIDADLGSLTWEVPDTMSPNAYIVIFDDESDELIAASRNFKLRHPMLARISVDEEGSCPTCPYYETFDPALHGWSFDNTGRNFNPALRSDEARFDYATATDPVTDDAFPRHMINPPLSAKRHYYPDWLNFTKTFGIPECYYEVESTLRPRFDALTTWSFLAKGGAGGSCHGMMAGVGFAFFDPDGLAREIPEFALVDDLLNLQTIALDNPLRDGITQLHGYQFSTLSRSTATTKLTSVTPMATVEELKTFFMEDMDATGQLSNLVTIEVRVANDAPPELKRLGGAHALVAYKVVEKEDDPEIEIHVYDPNFPTEKGRAIIVNSETNEWRYDLGDGVRWKGTAGFYTVPYATFMTLSSILHTLPENIIMYSNPGMEIDAVNESGADFTYTQEGGFVGSDPSADPLYPINGPSHPYGYILDKSGHTLDATAADSSGIGLALFRDAFAFNYQSDAVDGQTDRIAWDDAGMTITNPGATPRTILLDALFRLEGGERSIAVHALELAGGDSIRFEIVEDDLRAINYGGATDYEITIRQITRDGMQEGSYDTVDLAAGATHTLAPEWWDLGTLLPIHIDPASGGAADTLYLLNHLMGVPEGGASAITGIRVASPLPDLSTMTMTLQQSGTIRIDAHDALGKNVATLFEGKRESGTLALPIDASRLAPGYYILHVTLDGRSAGSVMRVR